MRVRQGNGTLHLCGIRVRPAHMERAWPNGEGQPGVLKQVWGMCVGTWLGFIGTLLPYLSPPVPQSWAWLRDTGKSYCPFPCEHGCVGSAAVPEWRKRAAVSSSSLAFPHPGPPGAA